MYNEFKKICRVCMTNGSYDIFCKYQTNNVGNNLSSFDKLVEKLRYVTMLKIDESDNLPKSLCDLCIIQLNVAYNFKRQAVDSARKLQQYCIENAITNDDMPDISDTGNSSTTTSTLGFTEIPAMIKREIIELEESVEQNPTISSENTSSCMQIPNTNASISTTPYMVNLGDCNISNLSALTSYNSNRNLSSDREIRTQPIFSQESNADITPMPTATTNPTQTPTKLPLSKPIRAKLSKVHRFRAKELGRLKINMQFPFEISENDIRNKRKTKLENDSKDKQKVQCEKNIPVDLLKRKLSKKT